MSHNEKSPTIEALIATLKDSDSSSCRQVLEHLVYLYIRHANDVSLRASMRNTLKDALGDEDTFLCVLEAVARLLGEQQERKFKARWDGDLQFELIEVDRDVRWSWICHALRERYATWKSPNPLYESALKLTADQDAAATAINALTIVQDLAMLSELREKGPVFHVPIGAPDLPSIFMGWPFHDLGRAIDYMAVAARGDDRGETDHQCPQCGQMDATLSVSEASVYDERLMLPPAPRPKWVDWVDKLENFLPSSTATIVFVLVVGTALTIALTLSGFRFAYFVWIAMGVYFVVIVGTWSASLFAIKFDSKASGAQRETKREWSKFDYCGRCDGVFRPDQDRLMSPDEMQSLLSRVQRSFRPAEKSSAVADVYGIEGRYQRAAQKPTVLQKLWGVFGIALAVVGTVETITLSFGLLPRQAPTILVPTQEQILLARTEEGYQSYLSAMIKSITGDYDEVIDELAHAIRLEPTLMEAYYYRGLIYLHLSERARGVADLETVLELSTDPDLRRNAEKELLLTKVASALVPVHFSSVAVIIILTFMDETIRRRFTAVLIADVLVYVFTAVFFTLH